MLASILLIIPLATSNVERMFIAKVFISSMLGIYHHSIVPVYFLQATLFILNSVQTVT